MLSRRQALTGLFATPLFGAAERPFLIAHRGGVVGSEHAENSPASVEAAIRRGYGMIEVDIRRTKDGHAIVQHDESFQRFFGTGAKAGELTWREVQKLRATPGGTRPMDFDELCARCAGRIRLMLDIKSETFPEEFYEGLEGSLRKHGLLHNAFTLGGPRVKTFFKGKLRLSANRKDLAAAVERGEDVGRLYYLFELGSVLDAEAVALCRKHNVTPVAALNTFRYEMEKIDPWEGARRDVTKLKALGVRHYQIDSIYDSLLLG
ncbi:MAG TPA: glycerophosphodiester phosphodiesterase family protein [Bryobacteraceae bacterium]|nr:glycerophosphodiester phosphodiesterase family protein [Bryobacteraceae bacterium]